MSEQGFEARDRHNQQRPMLKPPKINMTRKTHNTPAEKKAAPKKRKAPVKAPEPEEESDYSGLEDSEPSDQEMPEVAAVDNAQVLAAAQERTESMKVKLQKQADSEADTSPSAVIYLGHVPHGFFEPQMQSFFGQFGTVTNLRLARSKRTGASKGYGFVQFQYLGIAEIVAEAMNGYMMFGRTLTCQVMPVNKVHKNLFKGVQRRNGQHLRAQRKFRIAMNKEKTAEQTTKRQQRLIKREALLRKRLAAQGIDYEFDGYAAEAPEQPAAAAVEPPRKKTKTATPATIVEEPEEQEEQEEPAAVEPTPKKPTRAASKKKTALSQKKKTTSQKKTTSTTPGKKKQQSKRKPSKRKAPTN